MGIGLSEADTRFRERVHMWRVKVLGPIAVEIQGPLVIREQYYDVREIFIPE